MVDRSDGTHRQDRGVILYEPDGLLESFHPLTWTRPVGHLLLGAASIAEKIALRVGRRVDAILTAPDLRAVSGRPADCVPEAGAFPAAALFLSSGFLPEKDPAGMDLPPDRGVIFRDEGGKIRGFHLPAHDGGLDPETLRNPSETTLAERSGLAFVHATIPGRPLEHLWDLVDLNPVEIAEDVIRISRGTGREIDGTVHGTALIEGEYAAVVAQGAVVGPFALLDTSRGPIFVGPGAMVGPRATIEGPASIGPGARIVGGARVRGGTTIGPGCRVGGEVEQSILQAFVNKVHDGFLGHAFVGAWVNLGAGSTNSDLKNNYGAVRVRIAGGEVDTGRLKVGCFLGDHVKTGIGTLMNTGFVCGPGCNLFGGRGVLPKRIPPFVWGDGERMMEHRIDRFLETTATAMGRRGVTMGEAAARFFRALFERTAGERAAYLGG